MKALISGLVIGLSVLSASAQKSPIKFGQIPMEDMKMSVYEKDSSAEAVVLADYGESYIMINGDHASLNIERHVRIKILKKEGLEWADVAIPLLHAGSAEEKVSNLKAVTYNLENDKIIESKISKDGVFKEKFNKRINLHKFTFPNVKEGSVIEYSYRIVSDLLDNFPDWEFQSTIPVRHSEYWAIIPEFLIFEKYMQGYLSIANYEIKDITMSDYRAQGHHWIVQEAPAFKIEPYMTCEDDYISKINFALSHINFPGEPVQEIMGSWQKLNNDLLENEDFGGAIRGNNFLKKQAEELTSGITDPMQKITSLHNYVKQNIEWDDEMDFTASNLKKIIEAKKGNSGDINLLLASLLEKAGFNVEMVLLSTRDHGFIRTSYPMERQFNYAVCTVRLDGKIVWLDATEKFLPINVLPERCLNGQGLIISQKNHGWISLETKTKAKTLISADLVLNESGELKGKLNFIRDGYDAQRMRKTYSSKGQETYVKDWLATKTWQVKKSDFQNIKEIDQSAKETHELSINDHANVAGNIIYINPFVTSQIESNPFTLETREYPVDFSSALEKTYMFKLTIPEGYTIDETPKSKIITLPGNTAKYLYNVVQAGNMINITSTFQVNKNIFVQNEYPYLREFYNQMIAKQSEQIVLKKK